MRPLLGDDPAAGEPATPAFYSDGSLALVYGLLRTPTAVGEVVADPVARSLSGVPLVPEGWQHDW